MTPYEIHAALAVLATEIEAGNQADALSQLRALQTRLGVTGLTDPSAVVAASADEVATLKRQLEATQKDVEVYKGYWQNACAKINSMRNLAPLRASYAAALAAVRTMGAISGIEDVED